jgi:hypothetical protein
MSRHKLVHQITSGLAGWLTFEHMRREVDDLEEKDLAKPLRAIAKARGFEVKREFCLPMNRRTKGTPRIDFLMVHREQRLVVALETKYKHEGPMSGGIGKDGAKLHGLTIDVINQQIRAGRGGPAVKRPVVDYRLVRVVLFVWRKDSILDQMKKEPEIIREQFGKLVAAMLPEDSQDDDDTCRQALLGQVAGRPVGVAAGSLRAGSTITEKRFWVASLIWQSGWCDLVVRRDVRAD